MGKRYRLRVGSVTHIYRIPGNCRICRHLDRGKAAPRWAHRVSRRQPARREPQQRNHHPQYLFHGITACRVFQHRRKVSPPGLEAFKVQTNSFLLAKDPDAKMSEGQCRKYMVVVDGRSWQTFRTPYEGNLRPASSANSARDEFTAF